MRSSPCRVLGSDEDVPEQNDEHTCQPARFTSRTKPVGENIQ